MISNEEFTSVDDLICALRERNHEARESFRREISGPLGQLLDRLSDQIPPQLDREELTEHALAAAEAFARTRPTGVASTWFEFQTSVLFQVARLVLTPQEQPDSTLAAPRLSVKDAPYRFETIFSPLAPPYSGDWFASHTDANDVIWLLVADVTDHGLLAFLIANGLAEIWRDIWQNRSGYFEPWEVLAALHDELADCLPEGTYVECTLAQLNRQGQVKVAPAGSRVILRKARRATDLHRLSGGWLGLIRPELVDQHQFHMARGDEILLATNGFFDQMTRDELSRILMRHSVGSLFKSVREILEESLQKKRPEDDITAVVATFPPLSTRTMV